jgi:hypothetical protein
MILFKFGAGSTAAMVVFFAPALKKSPHFLIARFCYAIGFCKATSIYLYSLTLRTFISSLVENTYKKARKPILLK